MHVCRRYRAETGDSAPAVVVSTASPYKFAPDVLSALTGGGAAEDAFRAVGLLAEKTGVPVPAPIASLESKPLRFSEVCGKDEMGAAVLRAAGAGG